MPRVLAPCRPLPPGWHRPGYPGQAGAREHAGAHAQPCWPASTVRNILLTRGIGLTTHDSGLREGSGLGARGSGLRAQGSGLRAQGSGLGAQGSGLGAQGSGLGARGSGIKDQGSGLRAQGSGLRAQGSGLRLMTHGQPEPILIVIIACYSLGRTREA